MMHTVIPLEIVFAQQEIRSALNEISRNGINLLVEQLPDGRNRVERILSTNPLDYLDPAIQPGVFL